MFFFVHVSGSLYKIYILRYSYVSQGAVWSSLFFSGFDSFFFPHLKTHVPNTTRRMPGKTLLKKDSSLPSIMTNVMRKREGLSVVRLNMSSLTLSLGSICLHNQCCMLCAIWPYFARTPTVSHTQRNHNISLRVT